MSPIETAILSANMLTSLLVGFVHNDSACSMVWKTTASTTMAVIDESILEMNLDAFFIGDLGLDIPFGLEVSNVYQLAFASALEGQAFHANF